MVIDDVGPGDTVEMIKEVVSEKLGLSTNIEFYLVFAGRRLENYAQLARYGIGSGSTVWMVIRLRGGMDAGPYRNKHKQNQSF